MYSNAPTQAKICKLWFSKMILLGMQPILPSTSVYISKTPDCEVLVLQQSEGGEDNIVKEWLCLDTECRVGKLFRCCWIVLVCKCQTCATALNFFKLFLVVRGLVCSGLAAHWHHSGAYSPFQHLPPCPSGNTRASLVCSTEELLCHSATPYSSF